MGWGVRPLALLGMGWIALPDEKVQVFGGKGDIYIPMPVIGGGKRWRCRWSGHSWVALSDRRFEMIGEAWLALAPPISYPAPISIRAASTVT